MSKIEQCNKCRYRLADCDHYTKDDGVTCESYELPIDNSKMFSRWYKISGRIGRLEYAITVGIAVVLYFAVLLIVGQLLQKTENPIQSETALYIFTYASMIPSIYLLVVAGIKRTHDTRVDWWYALTPLVGLFWISLISAGFIIIGCIYLFAYSSEEEVNEYGTNPNIPYGKQIYKESY